MVASRNHGGAVASLTIKNLPEDLLRALRVAAERDRRSLTQEIIHLLDTALRGQPAAEVAPPTAAEAQIAAWRKLAGRWQSDEDRETEAEAIAAQRTAGREVDL